MSTTPGGGFYEIYCLLNGGGRERGDKISTSGRGRIWPASESSEVERISASKVIREDGKEGEREGGTGSLLATTLSSLTFSRGMWQRRRAVAEADVILGRDVIISFLKISIT